MLPAANHWIKFSNIPEIEAERINEQLKTMQWVNENREIAWIRPDCTIAHLSWWQRLCIWVISFFCGHLESIRYFANYSEAVDTMNTLAGRIAQLINIKPELAQQYARCRKIFERTFGDSNLKSLQFYDVNQEKVKISGDADLTGGCCAKSPMKMLDTWNSAAPLVDYSDEKLIKYFFQEGLLAQALWYIQSKNIDINTLEHELDVDDLAWLRLQLAFQMTPTTALDTMALDVVADGKMGLGWGYKSANLKRLQEYSKNVSSICKTCCVEVPAFFPIGNREMKAYILRAYPELMAHWQEFLQTFPHSARQSFLAREGSLQLSNNAIKILEGIRSNIIKVFSSPYYTSPQLQVWLREQNSNFLIVRSTGKEDSDTNSNAGGNASIPFIKPNAKDISYAIGEVIASYFGKKSILQRIDAGDTSLFTEPPFMPVLIQEMITENIGGIGTPDEQVPRSGVMFTCSEGKARGLTELCVGLGNNEGVVTSSVNVDRYLLDAQGGVTKVVQFKGTRFVAVKKTKDSFACEPIINSSTQLSEAPALPDEVASDMKVIADYLSVQYGSAASPKPLDIEFTIKMSQASKPIIYLLQARPLITVTKTQEPSYLSIDFIKSLSDECLARGQVLLDGGAYARQIVTSEALIVCETITEALHKYLISSKKDGIKTIIIRKPAPNTSHEAVMFRSKGVGVLVVNDGSVFAKVKHFENSLETCPIIVDFQQGIVARVANPQIQVGYACYPMPLEYSLTPSSMIINLSRRLTFAEAEPEPDLEQRVTKQLTNFYNRVYTIIKACQYNQDLLPVGGVDRHSIRDLLNIMSNGNKAQARLAVATLLNTLFKYITNPNVWSLPKSRLELLMVLENIVQIVERQFLPGTKQPACSLERLYPIRLIEACLFQNSSWIRGGISFFNVITSIHNQQRGLKQLESIYGSITNPEDSLLQIPILRVKNVMLKPHQANIWLSMARFIPAINPQVLALTLQSFVDFDQLNVLTDWVNVYLCKMFVEEGINSPSDVTHTKTVILFGKLAQSLASAHSDIAYCKKIRSELAALRSQMSSWSEPDYVSKQIGYLAHLYSNMGFNLATPMSIVERYKACKPVARLVLLKTILECVRTYDELIKACTSSDQYSQLKKKAINFKNLLEPYFVMMRSIITIANEVGLLQTFGASYITHTGSGRIVINDYYRRLMEGGKYKFGFHNTVSKETPGFQNINPDLKTEEECSRLIMAGSEFNVTSVVVGGKVDFSCCVIWPETLEDYFTLFHQNMEMTINLLRGKEGFSKELLPQSIKHYCTELLSKMSFDTAGTFNSGVISGINVNGFQLQVILEIPMRQHAAKVTVLQDLRFESKIRTKVEMFGNPEHARWELVAACASFVGNDMPKLKMDKPMINFQNCKGVVVEFEVDGLNDNELHAVVQFWRCMSQLSIKRNVSDQYLQAIYSLRQALGSMEVVVSPENMINGGFVLIKDYIQHLVALGKNDKAIHAFRIVNQLRKMHLWMDRVMMHDEKSQFWQACNKLLDDYPLLLQGCTATESCISFTQ